MAASARWAASTSPTPRRTPPARRVAASSVSRPVTRAPGLPTLQDPALADLLDVLADLQDDSEGGVEVIGVESQQCLRPGDRLAHAGKLVELLAAQARDGGADPLGDRVGHVRQAGTDDLGLALGRRVVDPVVEAAPLERV